MVARRRTGGSIRPMQYAPLVAALAREREDVGDEVQEVSELSCKDIIGLFKDCPVYRRTTQHFTNDTALCAFLRRCGAAELLGGGKTTEADQLVKDELGKRK